MRNSDIQRRSIFLLKTLGVAALYALLIDMDHRYFESGTAVSSFEAASGFALAVLLIGGKRYFWGVFLGAILTSITTDPLGAAAIISSGHALEALCGAWLLTRDIKFDQTIRSLRDYLRLILLGGGFGVSLGALTGVTALLVFGFFTPEIYSHELLHWWTGDMLGIVMVTPLILVCWHTRNDWREVKRMTEAMLLLGLTFLAGQIVFLGWLHDSIGNIAQGYWMFLFIAWVAVRLGTRGTVFALTMTAIQSLLGAFQGVGFFANDIAQTQLANYWLYMMILSAVGMALATYFAERKLYEKKLAQSLNLLQAVIDTSPMRIFWKDRESRYMGCNSVFAKDAGETHPDDLIGKDDYQLGWKAQAELYRADDRKVMESGIPKISYDEPQTTPDGHQIWLRTSKVPMHDGDGKVIGVLGVYEDITERKQIEDALSQFKHTLDQTLDSIFMFRECDFHFIYVNEGAMKQVGYTYAELLGMTPLDIKPEFTLEHFQNMVQPLRDGTQPSLTFETVHRHKDGHDVPVEIFLQLVRNEGKEPRYMAIVRDIAKRKNDEAKIVLLSRAYRLLSQVNEAIVRVKHSGKFFATLCNITAASGLFRFVWIGVLEMKRLSVIPVAYAGVEEGYTAKLDTRLDDERTGYGPTGRAIREDTHIVCQDIENDPSMAPWRDAALKRGYRASGVFPIHEAGNVVGTINVYAAEAHFFTPDIIHLMLELAANVSFALDVFAEKKRRERAEYKLKRLNVELEHRVLERTRQLEDANKELEAFSYSVSHDLRAPLRSIDGFSRVLSKKYHDQLDATGKDWLERVCRASQHMGHLIDDMLQLSQVARSPLKQEQIDLSKIAEIVADDLRKENPERQVRFILQQDLIIHADPGLMRIVMNNLLGNAYKFTDKKAEAEIEFGVCDINGESVFFVRDNGAGFNMDYAHKLFGAFQRLHGADEFEGTGIGLATVQRVIHRHNGRVWAEAKEGQGATLYFTLPQ